MSDSSSGRMGRMTKSMPFSAFQGLAYLRG